ncbi:hypothetical protein ACOJBO_01050 [Rhizobium beringeri]
MTHDIEIQIEELWAELRSASIPTNVARSRVELELARSELAVIIAENNGWLKAEPPF